MSKLLSLKEWITLGEAAAHLKSIFNEDVSISDIYRFALSGNLVLSTHLVNHGRANLGRKKLIREAGFHVVSGFKKDQTHTVIGVTAEAFGEYEAWLAADPENARQVEADEPKSKFVLLDGIQLSAHECLQLDEPVSIISGVWDLLMRGAERVAIEHALQQSVGGPSVDLTTLEGAFLYRPDGTYARLVEYFGDIPNANQNTRALDRNDPNSYYPAASLPENAPIVVRPQALADFVSKASGADVDAEDKHLDQRERGSLLCIIGALAKMNAVDLSQPYKAAEQVAVQLQKMGVEMGGRTIGTHLSAVTDALDRKSR